MNIRIGWLLFGVGIQACAPKPHSLMNFTEKQLTVDTKGHTIHNNQAFSPSDDWLVYDTRNQDGGIGGSGGIEMVNVETGEIRSLYQTKNQTEFGPGVGAATFSPTQNRVLFIHGIRNANQQKPYDFDRRTGVAIDIDRPGKPIFWMPEMSNRRLHRGPCGVVRTRMGGVRTVSGLALHTMITRLMC